MTELEVLADVVTKLDKLGLRYAVGGSLASSLWANPRQTNDADIAIRLPESAREDLLDLFTDPYYLSRLDLEEAFRGRKEYRTVQIMHMDAIFKIDLFLLGDGEYETSELDRARSVEIAPNVKIRYAAPENIVIAKLRWFVLGNRVSDRQWNDIVQVLEMQEGRLDEEYLDKWAAHFGVADLLNEARAQIPP